MTVTHNIAAQSHHRWMFPLALLTSLVMLAAWFPLTTLWHQQSQIDATANQIALVRQQQRALTREAQSISSTAAARLLARQEYQLVAPGQSLIQVLPGSQGGATGAGGDPGNQPLVAPSSVSSLVAVPRTGTTHHSSLGGFVSRLVRTLEFWR
jgi:cell division protein FtsB